MWRDLAGSRRRLASDVKSWLDKADFQQNTILDNAHLLQQVRWNAADKHCARKRYNAGQLLVDAVGSVEGREMGIR